MSSKTAGSYDILKVVEIQIPVARVPTDEKENAPSPVLAQVDFECSAKFF